MCWKCKESMEEGLEIFRTTSCPTCGADLHSCVNCRFYEPGAHYDCHETVDEQVRDKETANFCGYFSVKRVQAAGSGAAAGKGSGLGGTDAKAAARNAFDNLFSV